MYIHVYSCIFTSSYLKNFDLYGYFGLTSSSFSSTDGRGFGDSTSGGQRLRRGVSLGYNT